MLFSKLSATILGLAQLASAVPITSNNGLAVREPGVVERGLMWKPRSLQTRDSRQDRDVNNRRNDRRNQVIIAQNINIQLTQVQIIQEVQIVNVVQNVFIIDGRQQDRDNIRRNHYRNRNRRNNRNVDTVVIVVVVVADQRDRNNRNVRYVTRQVESNPEFASKEYVVVTEASTVTVDSQALPTGDAAAPTGVAPAEALTTGTPAVAARQALPGVVSWDQSAPLSVSDQSLLLPAGIAAPRWSQAQQNQDPAIIIEDNQSVLVDFLDDNNNNNNNNNDNNNNRGQGQGQGQGKQDNSNQGPKVITVG